MIGTHVACAAPSDHPHKRRTRRLSQQQPRGITTSSSVSPDAVFARYQLSGPDVDALISRPTCRAVSCLVLTSMH
eukprot:2668197-Rhodomonas_salina.2